MKTIKKTILALTLGLFYSFSSNAQDQSYNNMFKVGFNVGAAVPTENASANVGIDLGYQYLVTPGFGIGIATGYNHFFGNQNDGIDNNDFGVVPAAAMFRYYPKQKDFMREPKWATDS